MPTSRNVSVVSHIDCPGGGQVWIDGTTLYVAHMRAPAGTSIYDVADPRKARLARPGAIPAGLDSPKVRAAGGVMIVNHERHGEGGDQSFGGGLGIYDVSTPARPQLVAKWRTAGGGVHRYDFDGRYAYL